MLEIDGKMAPQDKMARLVKCSKNIFEILKLSNESPASADDFLPCLIYICLKANPPRIQSNINFITRFCNENKLRMGEGGYFFANLVSAPSLVMSHTHFQLRGEFLQKKNRCFLSHFGFLYDFSCHTKVVKMRSYFFKIHKIVKTFFFSVVQCPS